MSCGKHGANLVVLNLEHINEDHKNLTQELVAPLKEHTQSENKVGLINLSQASPTNSYIEVELIDFVGVDILNGLWTLISTV